MGRETLKIVVSVTGAAICALLVFLLLETILSGNSAHGPIPGRALLFRFQLSAMLAMGLFIGLAIAIYARLSRSLVERRKPRPSVETFPRKEQ
jgi:hypothetical protein